VIQRFAIVEEEGKEQAVRRSGAARVRFRERSSHLLGTLMPYATLLFDVRDRVATITVNRPDKLNALNDLTIRELDRATDEAVSREDVGGVILTGAGSKAFVAGADIAELAEQGPLDGRQRALQGQRVFSKLERSPKPVIAAVNGYALGGGCELALACHMRVASEDARFGLPEVKLGICPGYGGTQRLPRLIGKGRALQLILTAEMIDAAEAYRLGLVNRVVPAAELVSTAETMLRQMLAQGPVAVMLAIDAVNRGMETTLDEGLQIEASHFGLLAATADMREGMRAFLEKRPARFTGA
jgi:enoyl-CoA hydratase